MIWTVVSDTRDMADDAEEVLVKEVELVDQDEEGLSRVFVSTIAPEDVEMEGGDRSAVAREEESAEAPYPRFFTFLPSGGGGGGGGGKGGFTALLSPTGSAVSPTGGAAEGAAEDDILDGVFCGVEQRETSLPPEDLDRIDNLGDLGLVPYKPASSSGGRRAAATQGGDVADLTGGEREGESDAAGPKSSGSFWFGVNG